MIPDTGKIFGSPGYFLRLCPSPFGAACQDDWIQMPERLVELVSILQERQVTIEAAVGPELSPELGRPKAVFCEPGTLIEDLEGKGVEVCQDSVAI